MPTIINTKLAMNRGKHRIYMEGNKLLREGFEPGQRYDLETSKARLVLKPAPEGKYTISRRERNGRLLPVVDICRKELIELFDGVETLRVMVTRGKIVVTAHYQQNLVESRVGRLVSRIKAGEPLRVASIFHGGGVMDRSIHQGLEAVGITTRVGVAVEIEGKYLESSLANNPELWDDHSVAMETPIEQVHLTDRTPQVDLLVGGIPCTGASRSGRSKLRLQNPEEHEAAGAMFFHFLSFVQRLNPALIIAENVPEYADSASMAVVRSVLGSLGYEVQERIMGGNEFGALENRQRLCVVGISRGLEGRFSLGEVKPHVSKPATLDEVLTSTADIDSSMWKTYDYLAKKEVRDKAAGKGFARQLLTREATKCGTIGRGYAKARSSEPFLKHPTDDGLSRLFTPQEHARLKGIPEGVVDGLSATIAHQILGQSVILPMFEAVAMAAGRSLLEAIQDRQGDRPLAA